MQTLDSKDGTNIAFEAAPFWAGMEAVAPTLAYDHPGVMGQDGSIPRERAARCGVPTLLITGGDGAPFMLETARTLLVEFFSA